MIARFVGGEWFIRSDVERHGYISLLGDALQKTDWRCFSFAVMSNHIHLGLLAGDERLGRWTSRVHGPFANWINGRLDRFSHVLSRGPTTIAVQDEGAASLISYIHRNPVRAGVVSRAEESTWTSHAMFLEKEEAPPWLDVELGLQVAGFDSPHLFADWFEQTQVSREQLEIFNRDPRPLRGRPKKTAAILRSADAPSNDDDEWEEVQDRHLAEHRAAG